METKFQRLHPCFGGQAIQYCWWCTTKPVVCNQYSGLPTMPRFWGSSHHRKLILGLWNRLAIMSMSWDICISGFAAAILELRVLVWSRSIRTTATGHRNNRLSRWNFVDVLSWSWYKYIWNSKAAILASPLPVWSNIIPLHFVQKLRHNVSVLVTVLKPPSWFPTSIRSDSISNESVGYGFPANML